MSDQFFARLRDRFPALSADAIHFDNAAGAQLPREAISRVNQHLLAHNAQKGSVFARQERMQGLIYELRGAVADFMGTGADRIALGLNATSLTALVAHHLGRDLLPGDLILTTALDHQANINPWEELAEKGVRVETVGMTPEGQLDFAELERHLARGPRLLACGWVSNATGVVSDLPRLAKMAHDAGALIFVDCVAGAPHLPMAFDDWDLDIAVASAYKIFGPHLGFVAVNPVRLGGWRLGELIGRAPGRFELGTTSAARLELGTQNHEGVAGFLGTIAYLEELGRAAAAAGLADRETAATPESRRGRLLAAMKAIAAYEQGLTAHLLATIGGLPGVRIYGRPAVPILSFNIEGQTPAAIARHLEAGGVEARTGNYLAIRQLTRLAPDFGAEAVRLSLVHYNTPGEIDRVGGLLRHL